MDWQPLLNRTKILPTLRDAAIIFLSTTYALGYLVWSIHASVFGLGTMPPARIQYFIAGFPILVLVLIAGAFLNFGPTIFAHVRVLVTERFGLQAWLAILLSVLILAVVVAKPGGVLGIAVTFLMMGFLVFKGGLLRTRTPKRGVIERALQSVTLVMLFFLGVLQYSIEIYPRIPQAYGGGLPECVTVSASKISADPIWRDLVKSSYLLAIDRMEVYPENRDHDKFMSLVADYWRIADAVDKSSQLLETGPILLWLEDERHAIFTVDQFGQDMSARYILRQDDISVTRLIGSHDKRSVGCPTM